ncbi:hypothetical protein PN36_13225 [Candidatus Thiomargarita nelsonii]|uniref:Uncharacterized protein n=1 Tax=Candidatus Thiomargarita nelsonii TaxID=1003181 RepID=A0A0A6P918_9GAMM|nr:hypothetical protein PN36_13225 [Candidatus Thiomargarita nelsonii]
MKTLFRKVVYIARQCKIPPIVGMTMLEEMTMLDFSYRRDDNALDFSSVGMTKLDPSYRPMPV